MCWAAEEGTGHSVDSRWRGRCGGRRRRGEPGGSRAGGRHAGVGGPARRRVLVSSVPLPPLFLASGTGGVREHMPQAWTGVGGQTKARPRAEPGPTQGTRVTTPKATVDGHPHAPSPWPFGHPQGSPSHQGTGHSPARLCPDRNSMGTDRVSPPRLACHSPWSHPPVESASLPVSPPTPPSPGSSWGCAEKHGEGVLQRVSSRETAGASPPPPLSS